MTSPKFLSGMNLAGLNLGGVIAWPVHWKVSNIAIAPKVRPHYDVGFIVVYEVNLCLTKSNDVEAIFDTWQTYKDYRKEMGELLSFDINLLNKTSQDANNACGAGFFWKEGIPELE